MESVDIHEIAKMAIFRFPTASISNADRVVIAIEFIYLRVIATTYLRVGFKLS